MYRVRQEELPFVGRSHEFVGAGQGDVGVSLFLFSGLPPKGPGPHRHMLFLFKRFDVPTFKRSLSIFFSFKTFRRANISSFKRRLYPLSPQSLNNNP